MAQENVLGQRFIVDATLWADTSGAGQSDQLQDTIDYTKVFRCVCVWGGGGGGRGRGKRGHWSGSTAQESN
jgi:hypothetical protein